MIVIKAVDFMATETAKVLDQLMPANDFWCWRVGKAITWRELRDFMMTFQAGAFDKPPRPHRSIPIRIVKPIVFVPPPRGGFRRIWRVRGPPKRRGTALPRVANGTGEIR